MSHGYEKEENYDQSSYPGYSRYRTLWDPEYGAMYGHPITTSPDGIENDINDLLANVWNKNYASKVIFIGHSFGGLVARYFAGENPEKVNTVITAGTPHLGTSAFYANPKDKEGVFFEYSSLAEFEAALPENAALRWVIPRYDCLDLKMVG